MPPLVLGTMFGSEASKNVTPTKLEAFVASRGTVIVRELIGRLPDGDNSVTVNVIAAHSENTEMRGVELIMSAASKRETIYLEPKCLRRFLQLLTTATIERARQYLIRECTQRGSQYGWNSFFTWSEGDTAETNTMTAGWLFAGADSL